MRNEAEEFILGLERLFQFDGTLIYSPLEFARVPLECVLLCGDFATKVPHFDGPADGGKDVFAVEGFLDEIKSAGPKGLDRYFRLAMAGDEQHGNVRHGLTTTTEEFEAVD